MSAPTLSVTKAEFLSRLQADVGKTGLPHGVCVDAISYWSGLNETPLVWSEDYFEIISQFEAHFGFAKIPVSEAGIGDWLVHDWSGFHGQAHGGTPGNIDHIDAIVKVITPGAEWLTGGANTTPAGGGSTIGTWEKDRYASTVAYVLHPTYTSAATALEEEEDMVSTKGSGTYTPEKPFEPSTTEWVSWPIDAKEEFSFVTDFEGLVDIDAAFRVSNLPAGSTIQARFAVVDYDNGKKGEVHYSDVVELHGSAGDAYPAFSDKVRVKATQRVRLMLLSQSTGALVKRVGLSVARFKVA